MVNTSLVFVLIGLVAALGACNDAAFDAASQERPAGVPPELTENDPTVPPEEGEDQSETPPATDGGGPGGPDNVRDGRDDSLDVALTCTGASQVQETIRGNDNTQVRARGDFCPRAFGKLNVLFIVDYSGSMRDNDRNGLFGLGCGRLRAAKRIIAKIDGETSPGDVVQVGLVGFSDRATTGYPLASLNDFRQRLTDGNFCVNEGATNYEAAFQDAATKLQALQGNTVVFLISDGLPTVSSQGAYDEQDTTSTHANAGLAAIGVLKSQVSNLTVNAIFLDPGGLQRARAETYLTTLTGDANRVKIVDNADQLADRIVELSIPRIELVQSTAQAQITVPGGNPVAVPMQSFTPDPSRPGVWRFETAYFKLSGQDGATIPNVLRVTASDVAGQSYESAMTINYIKSN